MNRNSKFKGFFIGSFLVVIWGILAGCQEAYFTFNGKTVAPEARIPLVEGGPHNGVWETDQMVFNYDYSWKSGYFEISGDLSLGQSLSGFRSDGIFFRVNFIDKDGKLIESKVAGMADSSHSYEYDRETWSVNFSTNPPPEAAIISFSYFGNARREGGWDEPATYSVWKSPLG